MRTSKTEQIFVSSIELHTQRGRLSIRALRGSPLAKYRSEVYRIVHLRRHRAALLPRGSRKAPLPGTVGSGTGLDSPKRSGLRSAAHARGGQRRVGSCPCAAARHAARWWMLRWRWSPHARATESRPAARGRRCSRDALHITRGATRTIRTANRFARSDLPPSRLKSGSGGSDSTRNVETALARRTTEGKGMV